MLRETFLARLGAGEVANADALEEELTRAVAVGAAAHPGIRLDPPAFVAFLADCVPPDTAPVDALRVATIEQLYLACACAEGDRAALEILDREFFRHVHAALTELRLEADLRDELAQRLRVRLLTSVSGRPPQISEYRGRGDLGRWLRAVAFRAGIDELRARGRGPTLGDDALADRALPDDDPLLAHMKQRYRADFKEAVRQALAELDARARTDLRLYYLEGLKLEEMATMHRIAPSTVSRRIARARQAVLEGTRKAMRERLRVSDADLDSILQLIESRLELSMSAFDGDKR